MYLLQEHGSRLLPVVCSAMCYRLSHSHPVCGRDSTDDRQLPAVNVKQLDTIQQSDHGFQLAADGRNQSVVCGHKQQHLQISTMLQA